MGEKQVLGEKQEEGEMSLKCTTAIFLLGTTAVLVSGRPQAAKEGGCGVDREGVQRQVGDSWSPDGCNNCRCLPSGTPGCTRRICSDRENWEEGRTCSEGKTWEEKTGQDLRACPSASCWTMAGRETLWSVPTARCMARSSRWQDPYTTPLSLVEVDVPSSWSDPAIGSTSSRIEQENDLKSP